MDSRSNKGIKTFLITSCKGGVGKSTVAANLAFSLASSGKRVLLVDCDFSNRSLDLILGYEENVLFDICDLVSGRATASKAVMQDSREERLNFIAAPHIKKDDFTSEQFREAIMAAAREFFCEYVFIDTPGALDGTLPLVAPCADAALIVTSHQPTTVRGAEKTGYQLEDLGVKPIEAVGKEFDPNFHNAVMQVESEEYESGVVAQEFIRGYMYRDQVIRHSMVGVAQ